MIVIFRRILLILMLSGAMLSASIVTNYRAHTPVCHHGQAMIRTFDLDGDHKYLLVDTRTLNTSIADQDDTTYRPCPSSRYTKLLRLSSAPPYPISNDGITHRHNNTILTTDLCPSSKKGFESRLYASIIKHFQNPVPVLIFVTGKWIQKHRHELSLLRRCQRDGKLSITWGNHTYTHPYHHDKPLRSNFALSKGYNLRRDTLRLEKYLIELGITPSIFFRFPGLISDRQAIYTIRDLGLITIGSDAWIAKGQIPKSGSIILLHGNKNEPKGVDMFLKMLQTNKLKLNTISSPHQSNNLSQSHCSR